MTDKRDVDGKWMDGDEVGERPVPESDRRRFLWALGLGDVIGVLFLVGTAVWLPERRTILLIFAVLFAVWSGAVFVWMSRSTRRKAEESQRRSLSS